MGSKVTIIDNSIKFEGKLSDELVNFLEEAAGEVRSAVIRNFDNNHKDKELSTLDIQLKGSYRTNVRKNELKAEIGSDMEAAYWEEFGTGMHAEHGDGRQGWWVYIEGQENGSGGKTYPNREEAEKAAAFLRKSKGLNAHASNGHDPYRTLRKAFDDKREIIIREAERRMKGLN